MANRIPEPADWKSRDKHKLSFPASFPAAIPRRRGLFMLMQSMKILPAIAAINAAMALFCLSEPAFASGSAGRFLKNIQSAADQIAGAMERAQQCVVKPDTVEMVLCRDDFRFVASLSPADSLQGASVNDSGNSIRYTYVKIGPVKRDIDSGKDACIAFMEFANDIGYVLPQKVRITLKNAIVDNKIRSVRFKEGDAKDPAINARQKGGAGGWENSSGAAFIAAENESGKDNITNAFFTNIPLLAEPPSQISDFGKALAKAHRADSLAPKPRATPFSSRNLSGK